MAGRRKLAPGEAKKDGKRAAVNLTPAERALFEASAKADGDELTPWLRRLGHRRARRIQAGARPFAELRAERDDIIKRIAGLFAELDIEDEAETIAAADEARPAGQSGAPKKNS